MTSEMLVAALLVALATRATLDCWMQGSIFSRGRARMELWRDDDFYFYRRLLGELMTCRFCLAYHVAFWLAVLAVGWTFHLPVVWLTAVCLTRLLDNTYPPEE